MTTFRKEKNDLLTSPTRILKIGVKCCLAEMLGVFWNTELNKLTAYIFLRNEIVFMHYSLQINQNIYSISIFRPPVVTLFIVKL